MHSCTCLYNQCAGEVSYKGNTTGTNMAVNFQDNHILVVWLLKMFMTSVLVTVFEGFPERADRILHPQGKGAATCSIFIAGQAYSLEEWELKQQDSKLKHMS